MGIGLNRKIIAGTIVSLLLLTLRVGGQTYSFKNYGPESKLPDTYVYSITQGSSGFLWISTGRGLVKFDGFEFHPVIFPDSVSNRYTTVSFRDRTGNLWFGCNDGSLFYTDNGDLVKVEGPNIQSITDITEGIDGAIYVISQDRYIIKIEPDEPDEFVSYNVPRNIIMSSGCFTSDGNLLLGTQENLLYCSLQGDSLKIIRLVEGIEYTRIQSIIPQSGRNLYLIGTEGSGLFKVTIANGIPTLSRFEDNPELGTIDVKMISEDRENRLWLSTFGSGAMELKLSEDGTKIESLVTYNTGNGLPGDNVRAIFQDIEGNIWMGLYGEGLSKFASAAFGFYSTGTSPDENNIKYITGTGDKFLLGTPAGYSVFDVETGRTDHFTNLSARIGQNEITAFHRSGDEIWLGTKGNGIYLIDRYGGARLFYRSGNTGEDFIRHITDDNTYLWVSTIDGVILINKSTGSVYRKYKIENKLPHNSINQIYLRRSGEALVATECDRLYSIDLEKGVVTDDRILVRLSRNNILCFSESDGGDIYAGTAGNGFFFISADSVMNITTANGLLSNYCYSILADSRGKVWIGHERGFSVYDRGTGSVKTYPNDFANGGNCNQNAIFESSSGLILIGTTEGLIAYNAVKDKRKTVPPVNNIISVTINNVRYPLQSAYSLPYDKYTIRFDYVGINLSNPEKVYYSTLMENWDREWSDLTLSRQAVYQLPDGRYRFNMMSVNEEGLSQDEPVIISIYIKRPFWRAWWFIISIIIIAGTLVFIIIREREKAQNKIKEYLESELEARTRLVIQQKDEIEAQNLEITDSINYAKRIQSSILPDINKLKETFDDAFIIFHPRDIVSGDFYWFDRIDNERFIVVCADSTGHGVPGAFMSMIGSTLLQDIISRKGITRPSEILTLLDKQIFSTLNQNVDVGVSNDGMDMVVFEINIASRHIRFASAMRPVVIVMAGEPYYIKGNRCSVGGESVIEKYFDDQEYYLSKGDSVYLFSDGFPDQFGGRDGKKMKINRLKMLIEKVNNLPMDQQKEAISEFFFEWKGDFEQVDDVILMGFRV